MVSDYCLGTVSSLAMDHTMIIVLFKSGPLLIKTQSYYSDCSVYDE